MLYISQVLLTLTGSCFWCAAFAADSDFLGRRPGLNQDVQLWNDFMRSEGKVDPGVSANGHLDRDLFDDTSRTPAKVRPAAKLKSATRGIFLDKTLKDRKAAQENAPRIATQTVDEQAPIHSIVASSNLPSWSSWGDKTRPINGQAAIKSMAAPPNMPSSISRSALGDNGEQKDMQGLSKSIFASPNSPSWSSWGAETRNLTQAALVATKASADTPCTKTMKACKRDRRNCDHVLDILQFLRMQNIAIEKAVQREANQREKDDSDDVVPVPAPAPAPERKAEMLLQSLLEKNGLAVPKPEDWEWADSKEQMFLQSALENRALALRSQNWNWTRIQEGSPPEVTTTALYHPIPEIPGTNRAIHVMNGASTEATAASLYHPVHEIPSIRTRYHTELPLKNSPQPIGLHSRRTGCPNKLQRKLDACEESLSKCKSSVDDHNMILNSIADRAISERQKQLRRYLQPSSYGYATAARPSAPCHPVAGHKKSP